MKRSRSSRSFRPALVGASACLAAMLAGCVPSPAMSTTQTTPTVAAPGPTVAAPTMQCTPPTGGSASACTQKEYDANQAQIAEYAEAEKVYRTYFRLEGERMKSGALARDEALALLDGPMVDVYKASTKDQHDVGMTTEGEPVLVYLRPSQRAPAAGGALALDLCVDGSAVKAVHDGAPFMKLPIVNSHASLARVGSTFKIWQIDEEVVTSC